MSQSDTETETGRNNETPRGRDFVAAGVPARTFSVGNAAVRSVRQPAVPGNNSNIGPEYAIVKS